MAEPCLTSLFSVSQLWITLNSGLVHTHTEFSNFLDLPDISQFGI